MNKIPTIDYELKACINRNSPAGEKLGDMLEQVINQTKDKTDIVIPVLGTQGMGKSTLINALLKADILPNDADETTCVPVEVRYSEKEYAEVLFLNNKPKVIVHSKGELNEYVDNNYNRANEKRVDCIKLYRRAEILRSGITIVDLPGVGSITRENEKTTTKYLEKTCTAIFVIPTVPTIRGSEATFIQGAWAQFTSAMFVQNDFGETEVEKKDSVEYNTGKLKQIASKIGTTLSTHIMVVNAYDAIMGALQSNQKMISDSGIEKLETQLNSFVANWDNRLAQDITIRIVEVIKRAIVINAERLNECTKTAEEVSKQRRQEYDKFRTENEEILSQINDLQYWLTNVESKARNQMRINAEKTASDIRADMWRIIDGGVYDGDRLQKAFSDTQDQYVQEFFDDSVSYLQQINFELEEKMLRLVESIEIQDKIDYQNSEAKFDPKLKWEKSLPYIFSIGGAVGGLSGAAAVAGFLFTNPGGWVVTGVGLAIAGIASLFGFSFKKWKQEKRAKEAKNNLAPIIDEVEEKLYRATCEKNSEFFSKVRDLLDQLKENREDRERSMRRAIREKISYQEEETLTKDKEYLETALKDFK